MKCACRRGAGTLLAGALLAGCNGGIGSPGAPLASAPNAAPANATSVAFSVTFPARSSLARSRRAPAYLSASIASLTFSIDGGAPIVVNAPAPSGSPQTVVTTVPASPGLRAFAIAEYDARDGAGKVLGKAARSQTIVMGRLNTLAFTLDGQLAKILIVPPATGFVEGTLATGFTLVGGGPQTFAAIPEDADGNTIIAPGAIPNLTPVSASNGAVTARVTGPATFTLQAPAPTADAAYVSIVVSGTDLDGKTVSTQFGAKSVGAFYVADYTAQRVRAFDESGTPLALPATAFANLTNPEGLAYVPGDPGSVVVTQTANYGQPYVVGFDPSGVAQTFSAASPFAGLARPLFLGYGAVGPGALFVPDYFTGKIASFDTTGAPLPGPGGSFGSGRLNPVGVAYDPNDDQLYVTDDGSDTITRYGLDGTLLGSATVGSHPMGLAYDANNKSLYVAYGGTEGAAIDGGTAQLPGITQFDETLAAASNTGGFANAKTTAYFTGIAVDPYQKQVYVADAGDSAILAFGETGTAVTLPAGAFSTIAPSSVPAADPMAILFVP